MKDYSNLNLDKNLRSLNSLAVTNQKMVQGIDFDIGYEVQTNRVRSSRAAFADFINNSGSATVSGSFTATGQTIVVTTTLAANSPYINSQLLAAPQLNVYQGTSIVGSLQMYPGRGAGITIGDYEFNSGYDQQTTNGTNIVYRVLLENVNKTGTTQIFAVSQWRYIIENAGTALE